MKRRLAADRLFQALDGRELSVGGSAFRVEVYGVFDETDRRWVQISLNGSNSAVLTLRLNPDQPPSDAVRELSSWLVDPSTTDNVHPHVV